SRSSSSTRGARGKKRGRWDDAPPCSGQGVASAAAAAAAGGRGGAGSDDDELPYTTQVALHRSLTSLLHVAEMRPTNWRRYCAISWSPKFPRIQGDTAATAAAGAGTPAGGNASGGDVGGEEGDLLSQFGDLPPVCILFALCENGG
ncbi:unnamed protein product, partial [Ectocarpus fasciculatus]